MLSNPVFWLHTVALVLQLVGAALVIREIRATVKNFETFRHDLEGAEETKEAHRKQVEKVSGASIPGYGGGRIKLPTHSPETIEGLVQQVGPGAAQERTALRDFVQRQFAGSPAQRWSGAVLVVVGAIVGYAANTAGL